MQADGQRSRRAAGHVDQVGVDGHVELIGNILGNGGAHTRVTLCRGVAVQSHGIGVLQQVDHHLLNRLGGGHAGVADAEIENVFGTDLGFSLLAVLKDLTDHGAFFAKLHHFFGNHNKLQSIRSNF